MSDDYEHYSDGPMQPNNQFQGPCPTGYEGYYQIPPPPQIRRTNSYHEHQALQVQIHPHDAMYRRVSESNLYIEPKRALPRCTRSNTSTRSRFIQPQIG